MPKDSRKLAMKEIRDSEWFMSAAESGSSPIIKVSPHQTFGKAH
jgi:peptide deformylase